MDEASDFLSSKMRVVGESRSDSHVAHGGNKFKKQCPRICQNVFSLDVRQGMTIVVSAAVRRAQLVSVLTLGELLLSTTTNLVLVSMEIRHLGIFMVSML